MLRHRLFLCLSLAGTAETIAVARRLAR